MRALFLTASLAFLCALIAGTAHVQAGQVEVSSTPTETATIDPCVEPPMSEAGEEVDPCITETASATATETVAAQDPTATMTPTLEYEIDVPVSFFPTETGEAELNETVAAATEQSEDEVASITRLPNAGGAAPTDGSKIWLLTIAVMTVLGSLGLVLRVRPTAQT